VVTAIAGLWAGGATSAFAAPCTPDASLFTLPATGSCDGGTIHISDGGRSMALSTSSYGSTQFSVDMSTNYKATIGIGMTDQNNGDVLIIAPNGTGLQPGIWLVRRTGGVDSVLGSVGGGALPSANVPATYLVNVLGGFIKVSVNGNLVANFSDASVANGKIGLGLDGAGNATSSATFWNILLGSTAVVITGNVSTSTPVTYCYDQWGHVVSCSCFNGTYYYDCNNANCGNYSCNCFDGTSYYNCNNCGSFYQNCSCFNGSFYYDCNTSCSNVNCGYCATVYGSTAPCQCYDSWGNAVSCNCFDRTNNSWDCGCHDFNSNWDCGCHDGNGNWSCNDCDFDSVSFDHNGHYWMKWKHAGMHSHCAAPTIDYCDGIWSLTDDGYVETCY
jgi:hypothetical protein